MCFLRAGLQMSFTLPLNCIMSFWSALLMRTWFLWLPRKHHKVFPASALMSVGWPFAAISKKKQTKSNFSSCCLCKITSCTAPGPMFRKIPTLWSWFNTVAKCWNCTITQYSNTFPHTLCYDWLEACGYQFDCAPLIAHHNFQIFFVCKICKYKSS